MKLEEISTGLKAIYSAKDFISNVQQNGDQSGICEEMHDELNCLINSLEKERYKILLKNAVIKAKRKLKGN